MSTSRTTDSSIAIPRLMAKLRACAGYYAQRVLDMRHPRGSVGFRGGIAFWKRCYPGHRPPPLVLVLDDAPALVRDDRYLSQARLNATALNIGEARAGLWQGVPIS